MNLFRKALPYWPVLVTGLFWVSVLVANANKAIPEHRPPIAAWLSFDATRDFVDFPTLYSTAMVVRERAWEKLYPSDIRTAPTPRSAKPHVETERRLRALGFSGTINPFLYTPLAAPLFLPLSFLSYRDALNAWLLVNWIVLLVVLALFRRELLVHGLSERLSSGLTIVAGVSMSASLLFRTANTETFNTLAILLALQGIRNRRNIQTAIGFFLLGVTKGISIVWLPFLFVWKKWKLISIGIALGFAAFATIIALGCGIDVWLYYLADVLPATVSRYAYGEGFGQMLSSFWTALSGAANWPFSRLTTTEISAATALVLLAISYAVSTHVHHSEKAGSKDPNAPFQREAEMVFAMLVFQFSRCYCPIYYRFRLVALTPVVFWLCRHNRWALSIVVALFVVFVGQLDMALISIFKPRHVPLAWAFGECFYVVFLTLVATATLQIKRVYENQKRRSLVFDHSVEPDKQNEHS